MSFFTRVRSTVGRRVAAVGTAGLMGAGLLAMAGGGGAAGAGTIPTGPINLGLPGVIIVLFPSAPCTAAAVAIHQCTDVIPAVLQIDNTGTTPF